MAAHSDDQVEVLVPDREPVLTPDGGRALLRLLHRAADSRSVQDDEPYIDQHRGSKAA